MTPSIHTNLYINKPGHTNRKTAGRLLKGIVMRISDIIYQVKSITRNETYEIIKTPKGWICSCQITRLEM